MGWWCRHPVHGWTSCSSSSRPYLGVSWKPGVCVQSQPVTLFLGSQIMVWPDSQWGMPNDQWVSSTKLSWGLALLYVLSEHWRELGPGSSCLSVPESPGPGWQRRLHLASDPAVLVALVSSYWKCLECAVHGGCEARPASPLPASPVCPFQESWVFPESLVHSALSITCFIWTTKYSLRTP